MRAAAAVAVGAVVAVVAAGALGWAPGALAAEGAAKRRSVAERAKAFAPWDAGAARPVTRAGAKGKARRAHPFVGAVDKVPGDGPPPPPLRVDADIPEAALEKPNAVGGGLSSNPLYLAALTYQHVLTKLDGPRCSHLPTCSRFASQAVGRHGALGILMGLDRLVQPNQSSAIRSLPEVEGYGGVRVFDPVDNYEFWKSERFTGFPPSTPEAPLPPLPSLTGAAAGRRGEAGAPSAVSQLHTAHFTPRPDASVCSSATAGGREASPASPSATPAGPLDGCRAAAAPAPSTPTPTPTAAP